METKKYWVIVYILLLVFAFSFDSNAGENWQFELAPYVWTVSMSGDVTVRGQTSTNNNFSIVIHGMIV